MDKNDELKILQGLDEKSLTKKFLIPLFSEGINCKNVRYTHGIFEFGIDIMIFGFPFFYSSLFLINSFLSLFSLFTENIPVRYQDVLDMLNTRNYILSSISQGLATIFALVFTMTLVMAQISTKYSARTTHLILSRTTLFVMFLYVVGIILPLFAMRSQSETLLFLCIILAVVCVSLLIPYFFYLKKRFDPRYYIESLLERVNQAYVEKLKIIHQKRLAEAYPMYPLDESGGRYWFNIPDDPLLIVLGIMTRTLEEGDYETFICSLESIKEKYYSRIDISNVDYLGFHLVNILDRCGEKIIDEKRDFLLVQLSLTLKEIGICSTRRKLPNINARISRLITEYLGLALVQEEFGDIEQDIRKIITQVSDEYAKNKSECDFQNLVSSLYQTAKKIKSLYHTTQKIKNEDANKISNFLFLAEILAYQAIRYRLHPRYWIVLASYVHEIGIGCAEGNLKMPYGQERRLSEWARFTLRNIRNQVCQCEEYLNQIQQEENSLELLSRIEEFMSKIKQAQETHGDLPQDC